MQAENHLKYLVNTRYFTILVIRKIKTKTKQQQKPNKHGRTGFALGNFWETGFAYFIFLFSGKCWFVGRNIQKVELSKPKAYQLGMGRDRTRYTLVFSEMCVI